MSDVRSLILKVTAPLRARVMLMVGRCVIAATEDATRAAELQLKGLRGEVLAQVEQIIAYGFTSRVRDPDAGGEPEAVVVCVGGNRDHPVAIATEDRRYRPAGTIGKGEVALYNWEGSFLKLEAGMKVRIEAGACAPGSIVEICGGRVQINCDDAVVNASANASVIAPLTTITGNVQINGNLSVSAGITAGGTIATAGSIAAAGFVSDGAGSMGEIRAPFNAHTHVETGGTTSTPSPQM